MKKGIKWVKKGVPTYGSLKNPIDLTGDVTAERYEVVLKDCLTSNEFDAVIAITLFQVPTLELKITNVLSDMKKYGKPVLCCSAGGDFTLKLSKILEKEGVPVYQTPRRVVSSMAALVKYWKIKEKN